MLSCLRFYSVNVSKMSCILFCLALLIACSNQTMPLERVATGTSIISTPTSKATSTPIPTLTLTPTSTPPPKILGEKPEPRAWPAMAYDSARQRIVLVGGSTEKETFSDTWEYDGRQWILIETEPPTTSFAPQMAYEEQRKKMVLFDWHSESIWEYSQSQWELSYTTTMISYLSWPAITYDPVIKKIVLFGERESEQSYETWLYDGVDLELMDSSRPYWDWGADGVFVTRLIFPGLVYDRKNQEIILQPTFNWTFALKDNLWIVKLTEKESPLPACPFCTSPELVYDTNRDLVVLFDGEHTWEYAGENWVKIETPSSPPPRGGYAMAYDDARGVVVLFGGQTEDVDLNDLWEYDGVTWVER